MNKKRKLTLVLILLIAVMVGAFYIVFKNFMYSNVNFFERYELKKEVSFAQKNIQREAYHLYEKTVEWARWDDTYNFIVSGNRKYLENNILGVKVFNNGTYFIIFLNTSGKVVSGIKYDDKTETNSPISRELETMLNSHKISPDKKGILIIEDKIFITAVHPILTSKGTGPSRGLVMMAREMDPFLLDSQHADKLSFKFEILKIRAAEAASSQNAIKETDDNKITESVIITDIFSRPAIKLEVALDRYMLSYTKDTLSYLILYLLIVSTLFVWAILYMVRKMTSLEKQIVESSKLGALGALGANISHELNNPLTIVHGYTDNLLELLEGKSVNKDKMIKDLNKIKAQTERMMITIKHIKEFTKYAEGEDLEPININAVISEAAEELSKQFLDHSIDLELKYDEKLPLIFMNKTKLHSVISNLLTNSRDAVDEKSDGKKKIEVHTSIQTIDQDKFAIISVKDNGIGISKTNISKIFDPYFTTKEIAKGSGLGLSLVQGVIKEYNGKIEVESKGGQTTFIIKLPINPLLDGHRN